MPPTRRRRGLKAMSKKSVPRRLDETEAKAFLRVISVSARKLNLVAQSIRGKSASSALAELTFSPRRVAEDVKKVLQAAIANAENNHQLDVDRLCDDTLPRARPRSRRAGREVFQQSHGHRARARRRSDGGVGERHGSKGPSGRLAPRHQPHLGLAVVRTARLQHAAARGSAP